jgi:hypothetical protein
MKLYLNFSYIIRYPDQKKKRREISLLHFENLEQEPEAIFPIPHLEKSFSKFLTIFKTRVY